MILNLEETTGLLAAQQSINAPFYSIAFARFRGERSAQFELSTVGSALRFAKLSSAHNVTCWQAKKRAR